MHDTFHLVAPWHVLLLLCLAGALVGAVADLLLRRAARWSRRRRMLVAATFPAGLLVALSALGWLASSPGSDGWEDLVHILWLTIALAGGALTFAGGLAGAAVAEWRRPA
jgi:hypothetical protein